MSFYENFFNSIVFFIITLPLILIIITVVLQLLLKNKIGVIIIVFIVQVILYYGYSCIIIHMRIIDVSSDYVGGIVVLTLVFGFLGTSIGNYILSYRRKYEFKESMTKK